MPLVHPCTHDTCNVLTMGDFCLEHERPPRRSPRRRSAARIVTASALLVGSVIGATLQAHFGR